jgi:hypothetical protein
MTVKAQNRVLEALGERDILSCDVKDEIGK